MSREYRSYDPGAGFLFPRRLEELISESDPVRLLLWAYANGIYSSRKIAAAVGRDITFMFLAGGCRPSYLRVQGTGFPIRRCAARGSTRFRTSTSMPANR